MKHYANALCFEKQGNRVFTLKGILLRAISLLPKRPEAYFLLARIYERSQEWQEGYTLSVIAHEFTIDGYSTQTDLEYPTKLGFLFEKAVCAWWIGLWNESIDLFKELKDKDLPEMYKTAINNNLNNLQV
jgi:hypothetical protein